MIAAPETTIAPMPADSLDSRQSWLAARSSFLGSSESPAVLGYGYSGQDAHTVWLNKLGLAEELPDDDRLLCGRLLQDGICKIMRHKTGYDIRPADEFGVFRSKEHPWLGATPDSLIHGDPRGLGVCELKNVDHYLIRDWKGEEPPLRVAIQLQHQLIAVDATWGIVGAIVGGNRPVWFELELHTRLIAGMIPALREFWRHVEERTPPPLDGSEGCRRAIEALYPKDDGAEIGLPESAIGWFEELSALKRAGKWIDQRRAAIENQVKAAIGESAYGILPDGRKFSWKQQTSNYPAREAYSSSFRVLRQHEPKALRIAQDATVDRMTETTSRLIAMGGVLIDESESGSRYFEMAGGLRVRVSDHEPNEKTAAWMDRREVASVRIDSDSWKDDLAGITGPTLIESEGDL